MTHPLTPREKVEREVLDAVFSGFEHGQCEKEWEPSYGREIASKSTDAILTALASGSGDHSGGVTDMISSGDHAELARLADDLRKFEHHAVGSLKIDMDEVRRIVAACDAHAALLAENAALRAMAEKVSDGSIEQTDKLLAMHTRATEAERKLAEADGLLIELADAPQPKDTGGRFFRDMSSINAYVARLNASKEAERG